MTTRNDKGAFAKSPETMAHNQRNWQKGGFDDMSSEQQDAFVMEVRRESERLVQRFSGKNPQYIHMLGTMLQREAETLIKQQAKKQAKPAVEDNEDIDLFNRRGW